jgi:hypothetical protein
MCQMICPTVKRKVSGSKCLYSLVYLFVHYSSPHQYGKPTANRALRAGMLAKSSSSLERAAFDNQTDHPNQTL